MNGFERTQILAEKKWKGHVITETVYGIASDYGVVPNIMRLMRVGDSLQIEWIVGDEEDPIDYTTIGICTAGKAVTDYDGAFRLPREALELLNEYGLDTKEVSI